MTQKAGLKFRPQVILWYFYLSLLLFWNIGLSLQFFEKSSTHAAFVKGLQAHQFDDFAKYYEFGSLSLSPLRSKVYEAEVEIKWWEDLLGAPLVGNLNSAHYPPYYCLWTIILPLLPIELSYLVFMSLTLAGALFFLAQLSEQADRKNLKGKIAFAVLALTTVGAWQCVLLGQLSFLLIAVFSLYFCFFRKGNDIAAGIMLALSTLKPQYSLILATPALADKRWRLLVSALICELLFCGASIAILGWETFINYPQLLLERETDAETKYYGTRPSQMISLRGPLNYILPDSKAAIVSLLIYALAAGLLLPLWRKALDAGLEKTYPSVIALTFCLALLCSPHTHLYDFSLILIAFALSIPAWRLVPQSFNGSLSYRVWCWTFALYPVFSWLVVFKFGNDCLSALHPLLLLLLSVLAFLQYKDVLKTAALASQPSD
ncbi:MAG: DUF2029 domain-containing protein [Candidatus Obscuribacterales bacterium]|nr:DUF2029 domain-containing protein [Candidatus Obscuribacterales bacterium]